MFLIMDANREDSVKLRGNLLFEGICFSRAEILCRHFIMGDLPLLVGLEERERKRDKK